MTPALGVAHQSKKKQLQCNLLKTRTEEITPSHTPLGLMAEEMREEATDRKMTDFKGWTIHHVWKFQFGAAPQGQVAGLVYLIQ